MFSDMDRLMDQLRQSEGLRLKAYKDTVGVLTVGYGHNCESSPVGGVSKVGDTISMETAEQLFLEDVMVAVDAVQREFSWVKTLNPARQAVLYDMSFNMGIGTLKTFKNTLKYVQQGDYEQAASNMLKSKWASQVGKRAVRLSDQMRTGEWCKA